MDEQDTIRGITDNYETDHQYTQKYVSLLHVIFQNCYTKLETVC